MTSPGEQRAPDNRRRIPDYPVVTITISGAPGSGNSVIAHMIRHALAYEGIAFAGPAGLRSRQWRQALQQLSGRGLSVILQRAPAAEQEPAL